MRAAKTIIENLTGYVQRFGIDPEIRLRDGFAVEALVEASEDTRLLVVGTDHRSRGGGDRTDSRCLPGRTERQRDAQNGGHDDDEHNNLHLSRCS